MFDKEYKQRFWAPELPPLEEIDPEIRELVAALNRIDGVATFDSCYGHSYEQRPCINNQKYIFIGMTVLDETKFETFFSYLLGLTYGCMGKVYSDADQSQGFTITLNKVILATQRAYYYRLHIEPMTREVETEKRDGIAFILKAISDYPAILSAIQRSDAQVALL